MNRVLPVSLRQSQKQSTPSKHPQPGLAGAKRSRNSEHVCLDENAITLRLWRVDRYRWRHVSRRHAILTAATLSRALARHRAHR